MGNRAGRRKKFLFIHNKKDLRVFFLEQWPDSYPARVRSFRSVHPFRSPTPDLGVPLKSPHSGLRLPCFSGQEDVIRENEGGLFLDSLKIASVWLVWRYFEEFQRSYLAVFGLRSRCKNRLQVAGRGGGSVDFLRNFKGRKQKKCPKRWR